jgi:hypothetical protein
MSLPNAGQLDANALIRDFGSKSVIGRDVLTGLKDRAPDAARSALEGYYAAVVRHVVEQVPGACAWFNGPETVSGGERRETVREKLDGYDMRLSDGETPAAVDLFGPLYQDLFPRRMRHALGEYYTPDWLAEHVLDTVGYTGRPDADGGIRLLDPTCGSGVFLLAAIRRIRSAAERDVEPTELGRSILANVHGFDVNCLAVLTARANVLLAIRDLVSNLESPRPAPAVQLRDVILDSVEPEDCFDAIVGNPPWVAWDHLAEEYRERTKPLWRRYGLFSLSGNQARHGGGKKDLSMLVLYRAADRYLRDGGRLGFVITQTLFQTKGAGDGFRRFRLGEEGEPLRVTRVDDMSRFQPFAGASNWTATIALEKGRETAYPVRYVKWRENGATDRDEGRFRQSECLARPIDSERPRSPWIVLPRSLTRDLAELTGPSDYTANLGANSGGANGVYWLDVLGPAADGTNDTIIVRNLASVGKRSVEQVEAVVEAELLYPLARWSDLRRWRAEPRCHLLLTQDTKTRSGLDEETMQRRWPAALDYLTGFREMLEQRAAYRRYQAAGPFWSMYNVGSYTVAPIKVVWRRMDRRINASVVEPVEHPLLGRRPVIVQETCAQVAADSLDEAHYLAAVLNGAAANFLVKAHNVAGGKGFGTPSMLDYLNVRRFDPDDARHRELAVLSRQAHELARDGSSDAGSLDSVQRKIDRLAGQLSGWSRDDLAAISG